MKQKIIIAVIFVLLIVAFFALDLQAYLNLEYLKSQKQRLTELHQQWPFAVAGLFFIAYVAITALALPAAAIMTIAGGAIFGFWQGLLLVSFASTFGATIAFLLTRTLFRDSVQQRFGDRLTAINNGVRNEGAFYVFGLRLVPLFPFFMVNSLLALTPLKTSTFYWASQLGMLAGTAVYVNAGTQLAQINSTSDILSPPLILSFVLLGVFPILAKKLMQLLSKNKST